MSDFLHQHPIILASGSSIRAKLLNTLGIEFLVVPSLCDEDAIKADFNSSNVIELGNSLASAKALEVSQLNPDHYVIAADQLCVIGSRILDKPMTHQNAVEHLEFLSGNQHQQIACMCIAKDNQIIWQHHDIAYLTMHKLTRGVIEAYLEQDKPYHSCGAYQFETHGKWLFKEVLGTEQTILGLPLLPLIDALIRLNIVSFNPVNL